MTIQVHRTFQVGSEVVRDCGDVAESAVVELILWLVPFKINTGQKSSLLDRSVDIFRNHYFFTGVDEFHEAVEAFRLASDDIGSSGYDGIFFFYRYQRAADERSIFIGALFGTLTVLEVLSKFVFGDPPCKVFDAGSFWSGFEEIHRVGDQVGRLGRRFDKADHRSPVLVAGLNDFFAVGQFYPGFYTFEEDLRPRRAGVAKRSRP